MSSAVDKQAVYTSLAPPPGKLANSLDWDGQRVPEEFCDLPEEVVEMEVTRSIDHEGL